MRSNGIDVGYKGAHIGASGPLAILALVFIIVGGATAWVTHEGLAKTNGLLADMREDHDVLSCVVSLDAADRQRLRQVQQKYELKAMCPWLRLKP